MIDVVFLVLPDTLLLDLAGPAEAFRLANQALRRRGRTPAFRMRHIGPRPQTASSVGLTVSGLEPLPAGFDPAQPTWLVLLGRPGEVDEVVGPTPDWLAARDWLGSAHQPSSRSSSAAVEPSSPAVSPVAKRGSSWLHSALPSSTPHWSKLLMRHSAPLVKTRCS